MHEGLEGPDPSIFASPSTASDFMLDAAKLPAAAAAAGPFFMAA